MTNSSDPFGDPANPGSSGDFEFSVNVKQTTIPPGIYKLRCTDVQKAVSQNSGSDMLVWDFLVVERAEVIKSWTTLAPNARWKIVEYANALGLKSVGDELRFNKRDAVGRFVVAEVELREYQGQKRPSIKRMFNLDEYGEDNIPSYIKADDGSPDSKDDETPF